MNEIEVNTIYQLVFKSGHIEFSSIQQLDSYLEKFKSEIADLSDYRIFKFNIYELKPFENGL